MKTVQEFETPRNGLRLFMIAPQPFVHATVGDALDTVLRVGIVGGKELNERILNPATHQLIHPVARNWGNTGQGQDLQGDLVEKLDRLGERPIHIEDNARRVYPTMSKHASLCMFTHFILRADSRPVGFAAQGPGVNRYCG